jgi:hypothetical protein
VHVCPHRHTYLNTHTHTQHNTVTFDFIDTSNVADYTSLPAILQAASPLLARNPHSRLHTESLVYYKIACDNSDGSSVSLSEFCASQIGFPLAVYAQICGLELAAGAEIISRIGCRMQWRRADHTIRTQDVVENTPIEHGTHARHTDTERGHTPCVSAGSLLLDLLAARKQYFTLAAVSYSQSHQRAEKHARNSPQAAKQQAHRVHNGANPATFAHLLLLAVPEYMEWFLSVLSPRESDAGPFRDELMMYAAIQTRQKTGLPCFTYFMTPGLQLLPHMLDSLIIVLTDGPLPRGKLGSDVVKSMQAVSAFEWDEEEGAAEFLCMCPADDRFVTM